MAKRLGGALTVAPLLHRVRDRDAVTIAAALGVSRRTIERWKQADTTSIDWARADAIAIRIGLHPLDIWPEFYRDEP